MATFVLIHGAWAEAWEWREVERLLRARGHDVTRPTLTGLGERVHLASPIVTLDTHVEDVVRHFEFEGLVDAVLCGHRKCCSWFPATAIRMGCCVLRVGRPM